MSCFVHALHPCELCPGSCRTEAYRSMVQCRAAWQLLQVFPGSMGQGCALDGETCPLQAKQQTMMRCFSPLFILPCCRVLDVTTVTCMFALGPHKEALFMGPSQGPISTCLHLLAVSQTALEHLGQVVDHNTCRAGAHGRH